ncbi:MAG: Lpg1974 family pore-forming outer membrane protein [Gammaproteobacteria bacterium]|jgi:hypothetical protein
MQSTSSKIFLGSLTSLAVMASTLVQAQELATAPELEGGLTASVGAILVTPSAATAAFARTWNNNVETEQYVTPGYDVGIDASIGYVFANTANSIELFYRNVSSSDTASASGFNDQSETAQLDATGHTGFELNNFDLMISQFLDIGTHMQVRFMAGASYVEIKGDETIEQVVTQPEQFGTHTTDINSEVKYTGWGPRLGIDSRYDFGEEIAGFGIVAGGSIAYFLGDLDSTSTTIYTNSGMVIPEPNETQISDQDNQTVLNLRGNVGVDYVYFFDNEESSTLGLELGYLVDYYNIDSDTTTFTGPYVNLKGVF